MEMALYYPELGYYTSGKERIGKNGDYYTSPLLTGLFGAMIARQLEEMWCRLGRRNFTVLEYGAGTGALCRSILGYLAQTNSPLYERLEYVIIERNNSACYKEKMLSYENLRWNCDPCEITPFDGCILSNELIDNFPVHKVVMQDELMEVFVDYRNGFVELLKPAGSKLKAYLIEQNISLPEGHCTEINLHAIEWLNLIAKLLNIGFVITIDYGFPATELYSFKRIAGTIFCYYKHRINTDPYKHIGEQDITAHVNFSALRRWGNQAGLDCLGISDQASFLHALGLVNQLREIEQHYQNC